LPVLTISITQRLHLNGLSQALFALVQAAPKPVLQTPAPRPQTVEGIEVREVEPGTFEVLAPHVERHLGRMKGDVFDMVGYLQELFKRYRVDRALKAKGIRAGDTVRLGSVEFEYIPEL
jgi:GTP-binding protein